MSVQTPSVAIAPARTSRAYSIYVLGVLLLVYTFNFIDRIVLGVLVPPIKAELGLTDLIGRERELGVLQDCFMDARAGRGHFRKPGLGRRRPLRAPSPRAARAARTRR